MNYKQFSQNIKTKYPEYQDIDDLELANKMIAKYPQYQQQVEFDDVIEQAQTEPTIMEKIRGISPKEVIKDTAKQGVSDILRLAPIAAALTPMGLARQVGVTAISRAGKGLLEGEEAPEALKAGIISGTVEAGIGKGLKLAKPVGKALEKPAKETAAFVGNILSSVPKESIEKALSNPRILKTKDTYNELGNKAKINKITFVGNKIFKDNKFTYTTS